MSTIPFSNPAGNNQTNPVNSLLPKTGTSQIPGSPQAASSSSASSNPFVPATASTSTASPATASSLGTGAKAQSSSSADNGYITSTISGTNGQNNLQNQLEDIYGKGVGTSLYTLLNSMSGTNSTILQEFISSLAPQEAQASANIGASLGAGGVGANSSVNAIAQSNLGAQETAAVASESAQLTSQQEQLTASLLSGMEGSAQKEVATSGWSIFGDVMNQITGDVGNLFGGDYTTAGNKSSSSSSTAIPSSASSYGLSSTGTGTSTAQTSDAELYNLNVAGIA